MARFRVFLLGPYRAFDGTPTPLSLLQRVRTALRSLGWDAVLAIDIRLSAGEQEPLSPFAKSVHVAAASDAQFFVFTSHGRLEGVASELTALQTRYPEHAHRRVAFIEEGTPVSSILDADQEGVFATPPIAVVPYGNELELILSMTAYARLISRHGGTRRIGDR